MDQKTLNSGFFVHTVKGSIRKEALSQILAFLIVLVAERSRGRGLTHVGVDFNKLIFPILLIIIYCANYQLSTSNIFALE